MTLVNGRAQISSSLEVANTFNDDYKNQPLTITGQLQKDKYQHDVIGGSVQTMFLSPCTANDLNITINAMSYTFSSGVHEVSNNIVTAIITSITVPLVHINNISMDLGIFPRELKKTFAKPLQNKKRKNKVEN